MFDMLLLETAGICLYRNILKDKAVAGLVELLKMVQKKDCPLESMTEAYCGVYTALLENYRNSFFEHITDLALRDENAFTLRSERRQTKKDEPLAHQASRDLKAIEKLASIRCAELKRKLLEKAEGSDACEFIGTLPDWNPISGEKLDLPCYGDICGRILWHGKNGSGSFSNNVFFTWDGTGKRPVPVKNPDPVTLDRLYLLDSQKDMAVKNTKAFLSGNEANNILFYGDRGTGKSSMVKALTNEFSNDGLRLVEVPRDCLGQIPYITSFLSDRGLKFILFIDDLAFENNEDKYTALKAVLEGGIEHKPSNVLLYATSNRRHLVRESFADRRGLSSDNQDEEIRARDNIQEKLSLADRFGITILFTSPGRKDFLRIVHKMAEEERLRIDSEVLEQKALQWEMAYNGMSPRTARQFIFWLKAGLAANESTNTHGELI